MAVHRIGVGETKLANRELAQPEMLRPKGADVVIPKSKVERQTVNLPDAFKMLGISRPVGYELAKRDALPVPVIRLGKRMVVSKRALEAVLNATKSDEVA